jgi:sugar/nucleoside kinase (ribokinase family)
VGTFRDSGECVELEFPPEDAADPMGAGDAFNAGYLAARLNGQDLDAALRLAIRCGRAVATSPGDTAGFPRGIQL